MFKLSLSLALIGASTALLATDVPPSGIPTYVVDPNEQKMLRQERDRGLSTEERAKQDKAAQDQEELIALYNDIVLASKEDNPGHGYGNDMHAPLMRSLENELGSGLTTVYRTMWNADPQVFSALFSPHNIRTLAYYQNKFGQGNPNKFNGNETDGVFLVKYTDPEKKILIVTQYSYFFNMLEGIKRTSTMSGTGPNMDTNLANLRKNLEEARSHYFDLSARAISTIAEILIKLGDDSLCDLIINEINSKAGLIYKYNKSKGSLDNIVPVIAKILKVDKLPLEVEALIKKKKETAVLLPVPGLETRQGAARQKPALVPSQSDMPLWKKIAAATGIAAVTGAIGAWYYNYAKTAPSTSRSWK